MANAGRTKPGQARSVAIAAGAGVIIAILAGLLALINVEDPSLAIFVISLAATAWVIAFVGVVTANRPDGVIVDNRNRVSLSKFQMTLWTILVVAMMVTLFIMRLIELGPADALDFTTPPELVVAMGIAVTSVTGAPLVLSMKSNADSGADLTQAAAGQGIPLADARASGSVFGKSERRLAHWRDMFLGDDVANAGAPDLSKVQQFLISVALVAMYGVTFAYAMAAGALGFPELHDQFLWLLGVSHAGYLAYKAVPHGTGERSESAGAGGADRQLDAVG